MDKAAFMYSQIYECSEICDIVYDSGKYHSGFEVCYIIDVVIECKRLSLLSRITPGLFKFVYYVCKGLDTCLAVNVFGEVYLFYMPET